MIDECTFELYVCSILVDQVSDYLIRALRRKSVRIASGWHQDSVRMTSGWRQNGVRTASESPSGCHQDGVRKSSS